MEMIRELGFMPTREPLHVCKCAAGCRREDGEGEIGKYICS
jgi:hypothetical protein